ncbi:hypothetical protein GOP47_0024007 [Adiantum capillus-veneris]|uniref:non-specific serine/threonine protein kinase n=1 Tax=Adiantum capillus-veneris TaxID=13818 RepID=A0A9D4U510_ADICA|nr:hypothetical protein GOP47_0024007 [Adiantum capillus-veneris]
MLTGWKQRCQNQNQFLQDRHGPGKALLVQEVIAVAMPACIEGDRIAFDLLCWTINMAARPGDSVVAIQSHNADKTEEVLAGCTFESNVTDPQFKPLHDLCAAKQVNLEIRLAGNTTTENMIVEEVSALNATMLVVTISGHHSIRLAQRRGSFLSRHLLVGCSIVVVKDYKVLFYKENHFKATSSQRTCTFASEDEPPTPKLAVACKESLCNLDNAFNTCSSKIWPESSRTLSPERVLDSSDAFYDSDDSPGSSDSSVLTRSLSRRALIPSSTSSIGDQDDILHHGRSNRCFSIWKGRGKVSRSLTFPASRQSRRALIYTHCKSLGNSFKLYMHSLWVAKPLRRGSSSSTSIALAERSCKIFTYDDISRATNTFSPGNLVGKGGHSEVYKGLLPEGQFIAVKRLIKGVTEEQKIADFLTELGIICHISHPNITPLIGFCIEKGLHLVFQFVRHGSLASWLHGAKLPTLKWAVRYRIAVGTARGLNYLHLGGQRRIIHRDIKASNILLGSDYEPQISDFGLAKWLPNQGSIHITTPIEGTFGYLAPEYFMHGIFDEKTDVFAFGVLLLELITGRKPIEGVVMWARPFLESMNGEKLVDARLGGDYDHQELQSLMMAAALCVQQSAQCRPSIGQVVQLLTDEMNTDGADSLSVLSSQSFCLQDLIFDNDYSSTHYQDDMRRHREIALQF